MFHILISFQLPPDELLGETAVVVLFYFYLMCSV